MRSPGAKRRARERRVLYVGLAVSVAVHLVLIGLASRWLQPDVVYVPPAPSPPTAEAERAMRAVALAEPTTPELVVESPDIVPPPPPAREVPTPPPPPPGAREPAEAERDAEPDTRAPTRTAAERLAPRVVDPRLWRPMVLLPREPNLQDVQDRIGLAMEMLSDSALADAERALRARDWTVEDAKGGRWGISPGGLHLGSVTLPLPLFFPPDMEEAARQDYWRELDLQLDRADFLESFDARVKAIRERRERDRARQPGNGGQ